MKKGKGRMPSLTRRLRHVWSAVYWWAANDLKANRRTATSIADAIVYELEVTQSTYKSLRSINRRRGKSPTLT